MSWGTGVRRTPSLRDSDVPAIPIELARWLAIRDGRSSRPQHRMDPFFVTSDNLIADRRFEWARDLQAKADLAAAAEVQLQARELGATLMLPRMTVVPRNLRP